MNGQSKKLNEALNRVDDEYLDKAERMKTAKKRAPWRRWGAAAAAVLLVGAGAFALARRSAAGPGGPIQNATEPSTASGYRIAAAAYPSMPQAPDTLGLSWDSDAYREAYQTWGDSVRAQSERSEAYAGALDGYLDAAVPKLVLSAEGENKVCSPLSVYMALAMLAETAGGESRAQLLDLLGADGIGALRERASALWDAHYRDDGATASILANSVWLNQEIGFVPETMQTLADVYRASSFSGDPQSKGYSAALRDWIDEQTGGFLSKQSADVGLDPRTVFALVSTVYFRARWGLQFPEQLTASGAFHAPDGERTVDFMRRDEWTYYWGERFSAVSLSLSLDGCVLLLLPDEGVAPEELIADAEALEFLRCFPSALRLAENGDYLPRWERQAHVQVHLSVPKFDVASDADLIGALKALGVTDVFDPDRADFTPMTADAAYVSQAEHAARVAIDENGVTAAAYTILDAPDAGMPPKEEMELSFDRPFVFAIAGTDGLPVFVGIVNEP